MKYFYLQWIVFLVFIVPLLGQESVYISSEDFGRGILGSIGEECFVIAPAHILDNWEGDQLFIYGSDNLILSDKSVKFFPNDIAVIRINEGDRIICSNWMYEIDNSISPEELGIEAFLEYREVDGGLSRTKVEIINIGDTDITIRSHEELKRGISGSSLYSSVNGLKYFLGMVKEIDADDKTVAYVSNARLIKNMMLEYFEGARIAVNQSPDRRKLNSMSGIRSRSVDFQLKEASDLYEKGSYKEAYLLFNRFQDHPSFHSEHLFKLGKLYEFGNGTKKDLNQALACYEKAAAKSHCRAMAYIGMLYRDGKGVAKDLDLAHQWLLKSSSNGCALGSAALGDLYQYGWGVSVDSVKAKKYYEYAASVGHDWSMNKLGLMYWYGDGVDQSYEKSREWFEKAAALGNSEGMRNLGILYRQKNLGFYNIESSFRWTQRAANLDNTGAMTDLGVLHLYGNEELDLKSYKRGVRYYQEAAILDDSLAQSKLREIGETWYVPSLEIDSDKDGISDFDDECPLSKGREINKGCPIVQNTISSEIRELPNFERAKYRFGAPREKLYQLQFERKETYVDSFVFDHNIDIVLSKSLSFYPGYFLLYVYNEKEEIQNFLYYKGIDSEDERIIHLDYTNDPIYGLNDIFSVYLNEENVVEYVYFFFALVEGRHGRFYFIDSIEDLPFRLQSICPDITMKFIEQLSVIQEEDDHFLLRGVCLFKDAIFKTEIKIYKNGKVEVFEGDLLALDENCFIDYKN